MNKETEVKKQQVETVQTLSPQEFASRLAALVQVAEKNEKTVRQKQIDAAFHGMELDDDIQDKISQYLESKGIDIVEEDEESIGEEEEEQITDEELGTITSEIDHQAKNTDDASEEDLEEIERQEEENPDPEIVPDAVSTEDPVRMYLKEIGRISLLKPDQEISLAKRMETGNIASDILDTCFTGDDKDTLTATEEMVRSVFELPAPEEGAEDHREEEYQEKISLIAGKNKKELGYLVADGNDARNSLTEANLRLVVSVAKKYVNHGMSFLDLIQEGNMGLIKAVDKFEFRKGFKFSTYATWWIRQAITRAIADQARTIRVPVHMVETVNRLNRIRRQLTVDLGRDPTDEELAKAMDMPLARLHEIINETQCRRLCRRYQLHVSVGGCHLHDDAAEDRGGSWNSHRAGAAGPSDALWLKRRRGPYPRGGGRGLRRHQRADPPDRGQGSSKAPSPLQGQEAPGLHRRRVRQKRQDIETETEETERTA